MSVRDSRVIGPEREGGSDEGMGLEGRCGREKGKSEPEDGGRMEIRGKGKERLSGDMVGGEEGVAAKRKGTERCKDWDGADERGRRDDGGRRGVEVRSGWREDEVRAQVNGWGCAPAKVVEGEDGEGGGVGRADGGAGMGQWGRRTRERETERQTVGQASTARRGTEAGASREPGRRVG